MSRSLLTGALQGTRALALAACVAVAIGCGDPAARNAPIRSPTLDFRGQPPTTSDGRVVGADNKAIEDRLEEQTRTGWAVDQNGKPGYDSKRRVGGHVDTQFDTPAATGSAPKR